MGEKLKRRENEGEGREAGKGRINLKIENIHKFTTTFPPNLPKQSKT